MKRILHFILEFIGAVLVCALVGIGILMVRLDRGPLVLARAVPEIESMISDMSPGLDFKIGKAQLETNKARRSIRMRLKNITVLNKDQQTVGTLKEIMLGFNWRNLVLFTVMPTAVDIKNPSIEITRFKNGYVGFNFQEVDPDKEKKPISVTEISDMLSRVPRSLRHIRVLNAELRYVDQMDNYTVDAHKGLFDFHRVDQEITGTIGLDISTKDFEQRVQGMISYDLNKKATRVSVGIKDFLIEQARALVPSIPAELEFTMPLDILVTTYIGTELKPLDINLQVTGKKGVFEYAPYFPKKLPMTDVMALIRYTPQDRKAELKTFMAKIQKTPLLAKGSSIKIVDKDDPTKFTTEFNIRALAENVPLNSLDKYWPQGMAKDAREWVTKQIRDGSAQTAAIEARGAIGSDKSVSLDMMRGTINFKALTVDYLPPMPPVLNVDGKAKFDANNFNIAVTGGHMYNTNVLKGDVRIRGLAEEHQYIDIDMDTDGAIKDAITIISSKPLEYAQEMNLTPDQFTGNSKTNLVLAFPLLHDLKLSQVEMTTKATLSDVTASKVVKDLNAKAQALTLSVDTHSLSLAGDAVLADAPVQLKWQEYFSKDAENRTEMDITGAITPAVLKGLRLPADEYFSGSAPSTARVVKNHTGTTTVTVAADLVKTKIMIDPLKATKDLGAPGKLNLNLSIDAAGTMAISDSSISWLGFNISNAAAQWDANGTLTSATLNNLHTGRTKANIIVTPAGTNSIRVVAKGEVIDVSPFWSKKKDPDEKPSTQRMDIKVDAKTVYLDSDIPFSNVKADILMVGNELLHGMISGQTDQGGSFALQQTENTNKIRRLAIKMINTGRVLQAMDLMDTVRGGTLTLVGNSTPEAPSVIAGKMSIEKFSVVDAPTLARIINAFSLDGLVNLLKTNGLSFSRLDSNFTLPNTKTIKLSKGKMAGDSLGLSFSGYVYRDTDQLNIKGTIIPIEGINKLAGRIPVLGQILTGLKSNGIFGATYTISGSAGTPDVSVNPLSALAPGILRSIFFESSDD